MNENWFEIVEILRNTLDSNYSKAEFVSAVENCFRVLGWRKTNGSLIKNYNLPNGSNVDIVLSKTVLCICISFYTNHLRSKR